MGMSEIFIHVATGTITGHYRAHYFVSALWPTSTDILCELLVCWTCVYEACGLLCSWDWCPEQAPYLLNECLDGLRDMWSFLRAPRVCVQTSCELDSRSHLARCVCRPPFASHVREPSLRTISANSLSLSLRVEPIRIVGRKFESFLKLGLTAIDV